MLVRFSVENFLSFRDRVELSMVASKKVRRHPEHVVKPNSSTGIPLLKLALIYGANASGKSNLIKAMEMGQKLVLHPTEAGGRIVQTPFKLDPECRNKPTRLEYEIKIDDRYFAYGFAFTSERVEEEWLLEIDRDPEHKVFERTGDHIEFGNLPFQNEDEEQFLKFTAKGTLPNRLFLSECRERNVRPNVQGAKELIKVLNWFEDVLSLIFPDSRYQGLALIYRRRDLKGELARYLSCFDTGIEEIDLEEVDHENLDIPAAILHAIETRIESKGSGLLQGPENLYLVFDGDDRGNLRSRKLVARHGRRDGLNRQAQFEMHEESEGTRRIMDLATTMMALMMGPYVSVIDELDRSLHPDIVHSYIANFLKYSAVRSSQLIITTHDTTLLKQPFLRRDEVWFVEKGTDQSSRLVALEEYKDVDKSKDLQQDYLLGRFGGVPVIRDFSWLGDDDGKGA